MIRISRKTLIGTSAVLIWLTTVTTGVHALLSNEASLTSNGLIVGSADLLVSNSQAASSTTFEKTREGFSGNIAPGQTFERYFLLKNTSSADIAMTIAASAVLNSDPGNMAPSLRVELVPINSEAQVLDGATPSSSTIFNLTKTRLSIWGTIPKGSYQRYRLRLSLDSNYSQQVQNISYDLVFSATQSL